MNPRPADSKEPKTARRRRTLQWAIGITTAIAAGTACIIYPMHPDTPHSRDNPANTLPGQGKNEEAEAEHRALVAHHTRLHGPAHPQTLHARSNLAKSLQDQGKLNEAEAELRTVLSLLKAAYPQNHPDISQFHYNMALCLEKIGDREIAKNQTWTARHYYEDAVDQASMARNTGDLVLSRDHPDMKKYSRAIGDLEKKASQVEPR